jgi:hypothetical protein
MPARRPSIQEDRSSRSSLAPTVEPPDLKVAALRMPSVSHSSAAALESSGCEHEPVDGYRRVRFATAHTKPSRAKERHGVRARRTARARQPVTCLR